VKADQTVEARPIVTGFATGHDTVVTSGVQPGERIVTDGQLRLSPGTRVEVKPPARPAGAAQPGGEPARGGRT
jgi:multidrug efflux system membrane fusion protein